MMLDCKQSLSRGEPCKDSRALGIPGGILAALLALSSASGCGSSDTPNNPMDASPDASASDGGTDDAGGTDAPAVDAPPIEPVTAIYINEVVITPKHDWGKSRGEGEPFDGTPGTGRISTSDQFIELYNAGTTTVDMRGWTLDMTDSGIETAILSDSDPNIRVSPGSTLQAVRPGAFVVVGDPPGSMRIDVFIELKDAQGNKVDDLKIGGDQFDGAPAPGDNGFARGAFDEAIARPAGAPRTGSYVTDFVKMYATPLAPNVQPSVPSEEVAPRVTAPPEGNRFPVTSPILVGFSEPIAAASVDGNVTLSTPGGTIPIAMLTFEDSDRVLVLNTVGRLPFDSDVTVTLATGAGGITDLAGNPLAGDEDLRFTLRTEAAPADPAPVLLNELCISPRQDWSNDSGGDGVPFSATPGDGRVSSTDEWIELLVRQGGLDLNGYVIEVFNGFSTSLPLVSVTPVAEARHLVFFGTGTNLSNLAPGDRVVIGDPTDTLERNIFVALRDGAGALVDVVEVGGNTEDEDRGGDGIRNGAPGPDLDGRSRSLEDEVVARVPDGEDTGDDVADWSHARATLGAPNVQ